MASRKRQKQEFASIVNETFKNKDDDIVGIGQFLEKLPTNVLLWSQKPPKGPFYRLVYQDRKGTYIQTCHSFLKDSEPYELEEAECEICDEVRPIIRDDKCCECAFIETTDLCDSCHQYDDDSNSAHVGNYVFCRLCYNDMDSEEIYRLEHGGELDCNLNEDVKGDAE